MKPDIFTLPSAPHAKASRGRAEPQTGALFQISTFQALQDGCYDGQADFARLAKHGDFGIGTLDRLNGEMVALDGEFYQVTADGKIHGIPPTMTTPFANVTFFQESFAFDAPAGLDYQGLQELLNRKLPSPDLFYALRVDGLFPELRAVSAPAAKNRPYPKLDEMIKLRKAYDYKQVTGSLVGFYFPAFAKGVNLPGYHMHFIDEKRQKGGHVQALGASASRVRLAILPRLELVLPQNPCPL